MPNTLLSQKLSKPSLQKINICFSQKTSPSWIEQWKNEENPLEISVSLSSRHLHITLNLFVQSANLAWIYFTITLANHQNFIDKISLIKTSIEKIKDTHLNNQISVLYAIVISKPDSFSNEENLFSTCNVSFSIWVDCFGNDFIL